MLKIASVNEFVTASSKLEAVTRLSALTGAPPETLGPGSKERKSVLLNLADGLALEVDTTADKPELGRQLATRLGMTWSADCWSAGHTITLVGLNRLLSGAHREVARRGRSSRAHPDAIPARSKLEAVTRISSLTDGPPQILGPGSKERKSVLTDLATGLGLDVDTSKSKPDLAESIVRWLGGSWDESCWSAGQTITLEGLNRVLLLATEELSRRGLRGPGTTFDSPKSEAEALLAVLSTAVPPHMDGRTCVGEMLGAEAKNWAQDEWRGWYFEFVGLPALVNTFGGGPTAIGNTTFDYSLDEIWDLKCHGVDAGDAILNSRTAMDECLRTRGVGLLVLSGSTEVDDGTFREWHKALRVENGKTPRPRTRPATAVRRSKAAFTPNRIDAFFVSGTAMLSHLLETGTMTVMKQGRQVDGSPRGEKYTLNLKNARQGPAHLASLDLAAPDAVLV